MTQEILNLKNIKVYRGAKCVLDIDALRVDRGELVSILGSNGSGKSTLLQVLNGLLPIRQGSARVLGEDLTVADAVGLRRRAALVFQDPLFIHDTVFANVALPLRFRGLSETETKTKVESALSAFRCGHLRSRLAHRLSGGEIQRVCLARAFVTEPELLLMDEPFSALDPATRKELLEELKVVALARQVTVLLVSHNLDEVLRFAGRAVVLQDGRIFQDALPAEVLRRPANYNIARLVGMDNLWTCGIIRAGARIAVKVNSHFVFDSQNSMEEGPAWCCLPGDAFRYIMPGDRPDTAWKKLDVVVTDIIPGIGVFKIQARCDELLINMTLVADQANKLSAGERISVAFQPESVHLVIN